MVYFYSMSNSDRSICKAQQATVKPETFIWDSRDITQVGLVCKEPEILTDRAASNGINITERVGSFFPHASHRPGGVKSE